MHNWNILQPLKRMKPFFTTKEDIEDKMSKIYQKKNETKKGYIYTYLLGYTKISGKMCDQVIKLLTSGKKKSPSR